MTNDETQAGTQEGEEDAVKEPVANVHYTWECCSTSSHTSFDTPGRARQALKAHIRRKHDRRYSLPYRYARRPLVRTIVVFDQSKGPHRAKALAANVDASVVSPGRPREQDLPPTLGVRRHADGVVLYVSTAGGHARVRLSDAWAAVLESMLRQAREAPAYEDHTDALPNAGQESTE